MSPTRPRRSPNGGGSESTLAPSAGKARRRNAAPIGDAKAKTNHIAQRPNAQSQANATSLQIEQLVPRSKSLIHDLIEALSLYAVIRAASVEASSAEGRRRLGLSASSASFMDECVNCLAMFIMEASTAACRITYRFTNAPELHARILDFAGPLPNALRDFDHEEHLLRFNAVLARLEAVEAIIDPRFSRATQRAFSVAQASASAKLREHMNSSGLVDIRAIMQESFSAAACILERAQEAGIKPGADSARKPEPENALQRKLLSTMTSVPLPGAQICRIAGRKHNSSSRDALARLKKLGLCSSGPGGRGYRRLSSDPRNR